MTAQGLLVYGSTGLMKVAPPAILGTGAPPANLIGILGQAYFDNSTTPITGYVWNSNAWIVDNTSSGSFTTLTVTGQSTLAATNIVGTTNINTSGAAVTTIGTGGTGAVNIGNATGNTAVTGALGATTTLTAGTGVTSTTGNITASAGSVNAATTMTATLGNITATNGNFVGSTAGTGFLFNANAASGAAPGPVVLNSRAGQVTFTGVSIAAAADLTLTITNSAITGASTQVILSMSGATTGSALSIKSVTPSAGSLAIVVTNGTGATTTTENIVFKFLVVN